jgi:hypothetical protein
MEKPVKTDIPVEGHFPCIPLPRAKAVNVDPAEVVNEISRLFKQHSTPVIPSNCPFQGFPNTDGSHMDSDVLGQRMVSWLDSVSFELSKMRGLSSILDTKVF